MVISGYNSVSDCRNPLAVALREVVLVTVKLSAGALVAAPFAPSGVEFPVSLAAVLSPEESALLDSQSRFARDLRLLVADSSGGRLALWLLSVAAPDLMGWSMLN
jgi:hypothetical protein